MTPFSRRPVIAIMSSCSRPLLNVVCAQTVSYALCATHAVRSTSWDARSFATPTSAIRDGNGPWRRVAIW